MEKLRKIDLMGIVNVTDNSYFAESRCFGSNGRTDVSAVLERAGRMLDEGADIIDIGGCSTRPGSTPVSMEEEWERLSPALEALKSTFPQAVISIDTFHAEIVSRAYNLIGPFVANDISAGEDDALMLETVGKLGLKYIAMHKRGTPSTMQSLTQYDDVTKDVAAYFDSFERKAQAAGIRDWILDPGFGFAKTTEQNWKMLRELEAFTRFGRKILVGISRKRMIWEPLGIGPDEALAATQDAHLLALQGGADILRVHDVAAAARTIELYRNIS